MTTRETSKLSSRLSYTIRTIGKRVLGFIAPSLGERLRKAYWKWRMKGLQEVQALLDLEDGHYRVRSGPFEGMRLAAACSGSSLLPKIFGSYESEILPAIESVITGNFDTIIDIGSAEGYYAVGLALRCPGVPILAYDIDAEARQNLANLAEANSVSESIKIYDNCTHEVLNEVVKGRTFVICDIEGAELDLMDPSRCPALASCEILIELHTQEQKDTPEVVKSRFTETHTAQSFLSVNKDPKDFPCLDILPEHLRQVALDEMRIPDQEWVWLVPTNKNT